MRAFSADNIEYSFTNVLFAHTAPKKHGVERYRVELYNPDVKSEVYETLYVDVSKDLIYHSAIGQFLKIISSLSQHRSRNYKIVAQSSITISKRC